MTAPETIVALSSGGLPSGIAIVRVSGPLVRQIQSIYLNKTLSPRVLTLGKVRLPGDNLVLDHCLAVFFPGEASFTGEDLLEFHLHGSNAVVNGLLDSLCSLDGVRLASPGEFTRRAFESGRLDLASVEGLSDLLAADTENQRQLALARYEGDVSREAEKLSAGIRASLVAIEADLDFSDSEDVETLDVLALGEKLQQVLGLIDYLLATYESGRILREGLRIGLAGLPNVGKSSVFNMLSRSEDAIVTEEPGTTRDIKEVQLNWNGFLVVLMDSAGIRETDSRAEKEGVRRTRQMIAGCDLVLWISAPDIEGSSVVQVQDKPVLHVANKADLARTGDADICICCKSDEHETLKELISQNFLQKHLGSDTVMISRKRDVTALSSAREKLGGAIALLEGEAHLSAPELIAEELRGALYELSRIAGRVSAEDILDDIFSGFCIGK